MTGEKPLGNMKTNPIKDGYIFIEWQYNGSAFDFSKSLDQLGLKYENNEDDYIDIELKAVYDEYTDETLYCKDENAVLDYATGKCYTVLKEDTSKEIYTHTTLTYEYVAGSKNARFCYAYEGSDIDDTPGGIYFRNNTDVSYEMSGKKSNTTGVYAEYEGSDYWKSKETCRIAAPCYETSQSTDYPASSCEVTFSTIMYNEEDALEHEIIIPPEGDGGGSTTDKTDEDLTDKDLTDKDANDLKTGDALIILAWIVGLCALGYTAYYFIKRNREN